MGERISGGGKRDGERERERERKKPSGLRTEAKSATGSLQDTRLLSGTVRFLTVPVSVLSVSFSLVFFFFFFLTGLTGFW